MKLPESNGRRRRRREAEAYPLGADTLVHHLDLDLLLSVVLMWPAPKLRAFKLTFTLNSTSKAAGPRVSPRALPVRVIGQNLVSRSE